MESSVPHFLILKLINICIHQQIEVKGNGYFNPIPEMVEQHEIKGVDEIERSVKHDVFDDIP